MFVSWAKCAHSKQAVEKIIKRLNEGKWLCPATG